jgi:hypothetical protein
MADIKLVMRFGSSIVRHGGTTRWRFGDGVNFNFESAVQNLRLEDPIKIAQRSIT